MRRAALLTIPWALLLIVVTGAEIPELINYQGMLTDAGGTPLNDTVSITFKVYNDSLSASEIDKKWEETHSQVEVINGLYNVALGRYANLSLDFSEDYWLDVTVAGEHVPTRLRFTSVGYAYRARMADSAVVAVSAPTGGGWTDDGSVVRLIDNADSVGIGTSSPTHRLEVSCTQHLSKALRVGNDSSWFQVRTGGNTRLGLGDGHGNEAGFIFTTETDLGENAIGISGCADAGSCPSLLVCSENGGVGIGTTSPATLLDIRGLPNNPAVARVNQIGGINWAGWRVDRDSTEKWFVGLGNTNENLLFRRTGSSDDLVIDVSGNVGIGISAPDKILDVNGHIGLRPGIYGNAGIWLKTQAGVDEWYMGRTNIGDANQVGFYKGDWRMVVEDDGNIGLGTTDPERRLHIVGDNPRILIEATSISPEINFKNSGDPASAVWALYKHGASDDFRFYQNGVDRLTIQNGTGNLGVGATDPGQKLDVNGIVRIRSWGLTPTHDVQVNADGDLCKVSSSRRYKKNIRELESHPDKILDLKPVSFEWKTTSEQDIGLIAEDVHQLIPELVGYDKEGRPDAVRYELVSLYLLEAMKELRAENEELRQRIEVLEAK